jgi:hypothetical protein
MDRREFLKTTAGGAVTLAAAGISRIATAASPGPHYYEPRPTSDPVYNVTTDICIHGATVAGVAAAIQAKRMGKRVVLLAFGGYVGGMTTGGLSATDVNVYAAVGGIAREFYQRVGAAYGVANELNFEPKVARLALLKMLSDANIPVYFYQRLARLEFKGKAIASLVTERGSIFRASYFVDASYEGDLMAAAGVSYTVGREGNAKYGERYNGVVAYSGAHNFTRPVDPFVVPGNASSGLLPGISAELPGKTGQPDGRVQAYNFRACVSGAANRLPFPKPAGYDPQRYELLLRHITVNNITSPGSLLQMSYLPNRKVDINSWGPFSTDYIGASAGWPEGRYLDREAIFQAHVAYQQGLFYFLTNDPRLPATLRTAMAKLGLPADEFAETGNWPHQLYIREARRMVGDYVMTEANCRGTANVADGIALATYIMDSHHCLRSVRVDAKGVASACNEGDVQVGPVTPYPVSYRAIVPRVGECPNLLVPVCVSASHTAYGSIRMEPTFFALGQAAGVGAAAALDAGTIAVQSVDVVTLQKKLVAASQIVTWTP